MAIENDPSARMQLRTRGELQHPGSCMVCGSGVCDLGYVDLGVFYDYEGTMYLCHTCVTQAAEIIGMFTPEQVESQRQLLDDLTSQNAQYKEELDRVRPLVSAVEQLKSTVVSDLIGASDSVSDFVREESESLPADANGSESGIDSNDSAVTEGSGSGKSEPEEPVTSKQPARSNRATKRDIKF